LGSRNVGSKCLQVSEVTNLDEVEWGPFYSPQKEPSFGTGHVWCLAYIGLIQVGRTCPVQGLEMSRNAYCNPVTRSDKSSNGLSRCEISPATCPVLLTGTQQWTQISLED
jgi:hypothetical protein